MLEFQKISTAIDMLPHWSLIKQLTPELTQDRYSSMLAEMVKHNYFQVGVFEGGRCIAVSGYWIGYKLYCGKYLEIDNFVVDQAHRSQGVGEQVLQWLEEEARCEGCDLIMLDAYVENFKAHSFYNAHGFHARGHHYLKQLS